MTGPWSLMAVGLATLVTAYAANQLPPIKNLVSKLMQNASIVTGINRRFWRIVMYSTLVAIAVLGTVITTSLTTPDSSTPLTEDPSHPGVGSLPAPTISSSSLSPTESSVIHKVYSDVYLPPVVPGISVTKGQTVHVTQAKSTQKWNCAKKDNETPYSGIEGVEHKGDSELFTVPHQNICLLIGRVGNETEWRPIGPKFDFVATNSGPLRLMVNEIPPDQCPYPTGPPNPECYSDNEGFIEVIISVG